MKPLRRTFLCALAVGALALLLLSAAAGAYRTKHACEAPVPGRASCLAMRLLIGNASSQAQPARTVRGRPRARAAVNETKPFAGFLTPERLHDAYELPDETPAGSTQTIAVVDAFDDPTVEADLAVYDKQFGLAPCTTENGCFKKVNQKGEAAPLPKVEGGWGTEISIDVQMARAICQSCHILLVEAKTEDFSDLGTGVNAAAKLGATEISNSYGGTEQPSYTALGNADYNHPGVVVAASSGDCGYLNKDCPEDTVGANFPADSPDVLSVGGTSLSQVAGIWTSTTWEEGGSGCSTLFSAALWQSAVEDFAATGCGSGRAIADVSAIGDPNTGVDIYDSTPEEPGAPTGWGVWGGTSVAAPIVAAEFGLAGGASGVSYPSATLYTHAGEPASLYDVVSGDNGKCASATICKATSGYDGPTGLGSPVGLGAFSVEGTPESTSPPTISGVAEQAQTLTEEHGEWTGEPTSYNYQWERCGFSGTGCQPIQGAVKQTYTIGSEVGSTIRVRETAHNALGGASADSAVVGPVSSDVPAVAAISPSSGITGSTVVVEGTALDSATGATIDGLGASFTVLSATKVEVTVPNGLKKGKVAITTLHGTATSKAKFTATLTISGFAPASGAAGATVTIKGVGFNSSSTVAFDGTPAKVVTVSAKKIKVTVPVGATAGPITVTNTSGVAGSVSSAGSFSP
ncbi:MAG TPA: IPT/TIG domain-containing protein [Solirubrobacteraceae bacterium]|jgi:hypothetical protein|nr:IPT/TIG domain-containing protein [Solirubrobacteraceae bacterium]